MILLTTAEARRLFNLYTRVARPRAFHEHCQTGDADRGGQPCPAGIAPIRLSIAETIRLTVLASQHAARLITRARLAFALRWSLRRRLHQAAARWHHHSARLLAARTG